MVRSVLFGALLRLLTMGQLSAAEYHVAKDGADTNDGRSAKTAFRTIQKGVDALEPGDTLTIAPGEYAETVRREGLGAEGRQTVIRAEIPGTAVLRGDAPASVFHPVQGYRFVYAADFDGAVEAVAEADTLTMMDKCPTVDALEFRPGACHYNAAAKELYISTSDLQAPSQHHYTVLVTPKTGLHLDNPKGVVVDGLAVTGFHRSGQLSLRFERDYVWGIMFVDPEDCVIRNCRVYLNAGGISLYKGLGNEIAHCAVYGNTNLYGSEGGGIIRFFGNNDVIRDCLVYNSGSAGIRYYLTMTGPSILRNNVSWGNGKGDFWIKGKGAQEFGLAEGCVSGGVFNVYNVKNCVVGGPNQYRREIGTPADCIHLESVRTEWDRHFADPGNLDFRLQSTSSLRGKGHDGSDPGPRPYQANVFYVSPTGDDANNGTAVELAWKTLAHALGRLKPGDTLYLTQGIHEAPSSVILRDITLRGRGGEPVVLCGGPSFRGCVNVTVERITFSDACTVEKGTQVCFKNCVFGGFRAAEVDALRVTHSVFAGAPSFLRCESLFFAGDLFAANVEMEDCTIRYSDDNCYAEAVTRKHMPDERSRVVRPELSREGGVLTLANSQAFAGIGPNGTSIGPYRPFPPRQAHLVGPFVQSVTDTTANIEWWTSLATVCQVAWGGTPACEHAATCQVNSYGTFSLTGLEPGKQYHFRVRSVDPLKAKDYAGTLALTPKDATVSFRTASAPAAPTRYFVAPDGDDTADGLSRQTAWRTIRYAAGQVKAGDTVSIAGGSYRETVYIRATGDKGRPITFRVLPGEKVVFDAGNRELANAFVLNSKHHVVFDGFYFFGFNAAGNDSVHWSPSMSGVFQATDCDDVTIRRCLMNGQGGGYCPPFALACRCERLTLENCVVAGGFSGFHVIQCPDLRLRHNVFLRNLIAACIIVNRPEQKAHLTGNIFSDSLPRKQGVQLFEMPHAEALVDDNNCYYLRVSDEKRRPFLFYKNTEFGPSTFTRRLSLAQYRSKVRPTSSSVVADPGFQVVKEWTRQGQEIDTQAYLGDLIIGQLGRALDFHSLFATNPEIAKRGCGLLPDAFGDFHFNHSAEGNKE